MTRTTKTIDNQSKCLDYDEMTPNGGRISRVGPFTIMDRLGLDHWWESDPVCQQWDFVDRLCDKRLLPFSVLPASDPYNRPGYPYGDPSLWTPHEAIKRYGCHLVSEPAHPMAGRLSSPPNGSR